MNYRHALVTGGAGFIGSHLIDALLKRGMKVTSVDNYLTGKLENLNDARLSLNFNEWARDVRTLIAKDLEGIDIIFHQAASKKTICLKSPVEDLDINAGGTLKLVLAAKEAGVRKFIHASTGSVYGELCEHIQDENHPTRPVSFYGISKLAGEQYVRLVDEKSVILRYFHVYGPRQDGTEKGGVISIFINRMAKGLPPIINGDGRQERSFTYVNDVVKANIFMMEEDYCGIFNVATAINKNLLDVIEDINNILGTALMPEFAPLSIGDIRYFHVSNDKIIRYGFSFNTSFKEGLRNTVNYIYKSFGK